MGGERLAETPDTINLLNGNGWRRLPKATILFYVWGVEPFFVS